MIKKISIQYFLGLGLALLTILIIKGTLFVLPDIGWHFMTVIYITVLLSQITFYYLTSNLNFRWTFLSFVLNFILWVFEQVIIEKNFQDSFIYQGENWKVVAYLLGGLLWATNKILIDRLFDLNKSIVKRTNRINV